MTIFDDFFMRALIGGLGIAIAAAPLGCFIVWRRMAYFSDATAHASILGVALALAFSVSIFFGTLFAALIMGLLVMLLSKRGYASDTTLGVLAHSALAIGLVVTSLIPDVSVDLMSYLFGDILAIGKMDLVLIWVGVGFISLLMWHRWTALILSTLNPDMARADHIDPDKEQLILTIALAVLVAMGIQVVGVLLVSSLLIIPAASARVFAKTPEKMLLGTLIFACCSVGSGLWASYHFDTPTGPTIVSACAAIFALSQIISLTKSQG